MYRLRAEPRCLLYWLHTFRKYGPIRLPHPLVIWLPPRERYRDLNTADSNPRCNASGFSAVTGSQTSKTSVTTPWPRTLYFMVAKYLPYYLTSPLSFNVLSAPFRFALSLSKLRGLVIVFPPQNGPALNTKRYE